MIRTLLLFSISLALIFPSSAQAARLKGTYNDTGTSFTPPLPPNQINQSFIASHPNLSAIEVMLKTQSGQPHGTLTLNLLHQNQSIATSTIPITNPQQKYFHTFSFPPIPDSKNQQYHFNLSFAPATESGSITLNHSSYDVLGSGLLTINEQTSTSDLVFRTFYQLDKSLIQNYIHRLSSKIYSTPIFSTFYLMIISFLIISIVKLNKHYAKK